MLNRGEYGARVGVPRILRFLEERELRATFFVPGHTVESFPGRDRGDPRGRPRDRAPLLRAHRPQPADARTRSAPTWSAPGRCSSAIGVTPLGFRAPSADLSGVDARRSSRSIGFLYDSSLMTDDYRPFHPRIGDQVDARRAARARPRVDACGSCRSASSSTTGCTSSSTSTRTARAARRRAHVLEIWQAELDWMDANVDGGILTADHAPAGDRRAATAWPCSSTFVEHCLEARRPLSSAWATSPARPRERGRAPRNAAVTWRPRRGCGPASRGAPSRIRRPGSQFPSRKSSSRSPHRSLAVVLEDVEPVPEVDDIDEAVVDDGVAPHGHLVGPAVERRISWLPPPQRLGGLNQPPCFGFLFVLRMSTTWKPAECQVTSRMFCVTVGSRYA